MNVIIKSKNPYVLDRIKVNQNVSIPAITRKNADFVQGILQIKYSRDLKETNPSSRFDPETDANGADGLYCGSTSYWFKEMEKAKTEGDFKKSVLGAVIAVDTLNKTHLEASISGRKVMRDSICKICKNSINELKKCLNSPFSVSNNNHLISMLAKKETETKKDGAIRYNLSFATKFCVSAASYFKTDVAYSKYDSIVSKALPKYVKAYLGEDRKVGEYKICSKSSDDRLRIYENYQNDIGKVLAEIEKICGETISRTEFDSIVWYCTAKQ